MTVSPVRVAQTSVALLALLAPTIAAAQDADGDSFPDSVDVCPNTADDQTDTNGDGWGDACAHPTAMVATTATLGIGVYIGPNSVIGNGVRVGNYASVGTGSFVGDNTVIVDAASAPGGAIIGDDTVILRTSTIYNGANVSGSMLGRKVTIHANASVQGASVGYAVTVGENTTIGANSVIGNLAHIENDVTIAPSVVVGRNAYISANSQIGTRTVLGPDSIVGTGAIIGEDVRIRKQVEVGAGAQIADDGRIGRGVKIGVGASVGENVNLRNCDVGDFAVVLAGETDCGDPAATGLEWKPEEIIGHVEGFGIEFAFHPGLAAHDDGTMMVVWQAYDTLGQQNSYARRYDPASGWAPIHAFATDSHAPKVQTGPNGTFVVMYTATDQWVVRSDNSGNWGSPISVGFSNRNATGTSSAGVGYFDVAADGTVAVAFDFWDGNLGVVQNKARLLLPDNTLTAEQLIPAPSGNRTYARAVSAYNNGGTVDVTVVLQTTVRSNEDLFASEASINTTTGAASWTSTQVDSAAQYSLTFTGLTQNGPDSILSWSVGPDGYSEFWASYRPNGGSWTRSEINNDDGYQIYYNVVPGNSDQFVAAYVTRDTATNVYGLSYSEFVPATGWTTPVQISALADRATHPQIGIEPSGAVTVLADGVDSSGASRIVGAERTAAGVWSALDIHSSLPNSSVEYDDLHLAMTPIGRAAAIWRQTTYGEDSAAGSYTTIGGSLKR